MYAGPPRGISLGHHAIIVGASISGLLAARVLSPHFDRVTLYDRDGLPEGIENRSGVPQGRHGHGLLASGLHGLKRLFPSLERELPPIALLVAAEHAHPHGVAEGPAAAVRAPEG